MHQNCCARCLVRLDNNPRLWRNKRRINLEWMQKFFQNLKIDTKKNKFVCFACNKIFRHKMNSKMISDEYSKLSSTTIIDKRKKKKDLMSKVSEK